MGSQSGLADLIGEHRGQFQVASALAGDADVDNAGWEAPYDIVVLAVGFLPDAAATGNDTNHRDLRAENRGAAGGGSALVANLALVTGVDLVKNVKKAFGLGATADLAMSKGEVMVLDNAKVASGVATPTGQLVIIYRAA